VSVHACVRLCHACARSTEELQTHGDHHRFGGTKKRAGSHVFVDPQTDVELENWCVCVCVCVLMRSACVYVRNSFRDTIGVFQKLSAAAVGAPAIAASSSASSSSAVAATTSQPPSASDVKEAMRRLHQQRLLVFQARAHVTGAIALTCCRRQEAISKQSTAPTKQCALCFKNRSDLLLSCEHSFCTACIRGLMPRDSSHLPCPLCGKDVHIIGSCFCVTRARSSVLT
jgi:hypothetical protein